MRPELYMDQIITLKTVDGMTLYGWFCGIDNRTETDDGQDHYEIWAEDGIYTVRESDVSEIIPSGWRKDLFSGDIEKVDLDAVKPYIAKGSMTNG